MKKEDLRNQIIPTKINNINKIKYTENESFYTEDLIYLDSYDEQFKDKYTDLDRCVSATDYAQMNYTSVFNNYKTHTGKPTTSLWLRSNNSESKVDYIYVDGKYNKGLVSLNSVGVCPSMHYKFPNNIKEQGKNETRELDIKEVKDTNGNVIYHTLQIGEYPKTKVDESLSEVLEALYNGGKIKNGIGATGRWYSCNGAKNSDKDYSGRHSPEFEYNGEKYARVISNPWKWGNSQYSDGTNYGETGTVRWVKVEPISFIIKNWNEMPESINPRGNGKAEYFDLRAEEVINGNIPFYPNEDDLNRTIWQNSMLRGFLNGIDVRNITKNGNLEFSANRGGDFSNQCNFINEAFNGEREPIYEYTIPESETMIPDDAFNGCISLKKLIIHPGITSIGKNAFDGLDFKYAYRLKTGELVFSQELPKNKEDYIEKTEFKKIPKAFTGVDYIQLIDSDNLNKFVDFAEILDNKKFNIPYVYRF